MDFENMKFDCPWEDSHNTGWCISTLKECEEENCAPFHFVDQVKDALCVSVSAGLMEN